MFSIHCLFYIFSMQLKYSKECSFDKLENNNSVVDNKIWSRVTNPNKFNRVVHKNENLLFGRGMLCSYFK